MEDVTFAQPERRNLLVPIALAVAALSLILFLVLRFTPHTTAAISVKSSAAFPAHTVFKSDSTVVGARTAQDDLYVLVDLHIDNHLRLPLFLKDFTATFTPSDPSDPSGPSGPAAADPITTSAIEKSDLSNLYTSFPALKALAGRQTDPPLLRETEIGPGQSADGFLILHFPITEAAWNTRKLANLTVDLYHQAPQTIPIPILPAAPAPAIPRARKAGK